MLSPLPWRVTWLNADGLPVLVEVITTYDGGFPSLVEGLKAVFDNQRARNGLNFDPTGLKIEPASHLDVRRAFPQGWPPPPPSNAGQDPTSAEDLSAIFDQAMDRAGLTIEVPVDQNAPLLRVQTPTADWARPKPSAPSRAARRKAAAGKRK